MPNYFTELQNGPSGPSYKVKDEEAQDSILALSNAVQDLSTAPAKKISVNPDDTSELNIWLETD